MIVEVAINVPIRKCFDYCWPEDIDEVPKPGLQVLVPFGRQKKGGVVVAVNKNSKLSELKFIESLSSKINRYFLKKYLILPNGLLNTIFVLGEKCLMLQFQADSH